MAWRGSPETGRKDVALGERQVVWVVGEADLGHLQQLLSEGRVSHIRISAVVQAACSPEDIESVTRAFSEFTVEGEAS